MIRFHPSRNLAARIARWSAKGVWSSKLVAGTRALGGLSSSDSSPRDFQKARPNNHSLGCTWFDFSAEWNASCESPQLVSEWKAPGLP